MNYRFSGLGTIVNVIGYRFLKSVLSFSKPQLNFQKIKMSRILLSITLNFGCSSYHIQYIYIHTHPLLSDSCLFLLVESSSLMNSAPFLGPSISPPKKPHLATLIHDVEALFVLSKGGPGFPILQPDLLTKVDFKNLGS